MLFFVDRAVAVDTFDVDLHLPKPGDYTLRILSPNLLELFRVNTKQPNPAHVDSWDWVDASGNFVPPDTSNIRVIVSGQTNQVTGLGFKRRPLYAPLELYDLRIANYLYLQLINPITNGQSVQVINDGTLWPTNLNFSAKADPQRYNPAIHVNQEGYVPSFPKKAMVGYYLGSLGEMPIPSNTFWLVNAQSGATVFSGNLTPRLDIGYAYTPTPYQNVREADFSSFTTPGQYFLVVPGMGASLPFRIEEGIAMAFARTYALGLFHQRSGFHVAMPFTRFTHGADHLAPASVPTNATSPTPFTWNAISNNAIEVNPDNPPQTAPMLTNPAAQLYPYINSGPVSVSGGHFEAGNYSRVTWNMAQVVHVLMFAVDALPGLAAFDNLGIPESGDGISDILQEAKWEADCLAKMQDADGGFYYMTYPQDRAYEFDVLPENGDPEVVWPKNTATTAAAVAALAQCASSPRFKQAYPQVASNYLAKARLGWQFLTNAHAAYGQTGAYQRIMNFGDLFTDKDELAWAACEMFVATGDPQYHTKLQSWFPDPTDPATARWGWWRMCACYGNAIRSYATAASSGRLLPGQLDPTYFAKCITAITNCGDDNLEWSQSHAYASSLSERAKAFRAAGWYFSTVQAFDMVVAQQFNPSVAYLDAILGNLNYEGGCNPVNVTYVTGLGSKRQRQLVDLYSYIDGRILPKTGIPLGNIQEQFIATWTYGYELKPLSFPSDELNIAPYPYYDRWGDAWNLSTEASTTDDVRCFTVAAWLAAQTSLTNQPWRSRNAAILASPTSYLRGQRVTVTLQVADTSLSKARIVWEARDQDPSFGGLNYTFTPLLHDGPYWIEAEVQWPDGRRAFASNAVSVITGTQPLLSNPQRVGGGFSFALVGTPSANYVVQTSTNLSAWLPLVTNVLPTNGVLPIMDSQSVSESRFYRVVGTP